MHQYSTPQHLNKITYKDFAQDNSDVYELKANKLKQNSKSKTSLNKFDKENGWAHLESFSQVLHTLRRDHDQKEKRNKIREIRTSLDNQIKEQTKLNLSQAKEKQEQALRMKETILKEKKEDLKIKHLRKQKMLLEKQFFDTQIEQEHEKRNKEKTQLRAIEEGILLKTKHEIEQERIQKSERKIKQQKEYNRLIDENEVAKQKSIQKKQKELEYDVKCLEMQEKLIEQQDLKRKQEKLNRENRIKARMDMMQESGNTI